METMKKRKKEIDEKWMKDEFLYREVIKPRCIYRGVITT